MTTVDTALKQVKKNYTVEDFRCLPDSFRRLNDRSQLDSLGIAISTPENGFLVHQLLAYHVYQQTGTWISLQSISELAQVLFAAWHAVLNDQTNLQNDIQRVNEMVLNAMVPQVSLAVKQWQWWRGESILHAGVPVWEQRRNDTVLPRTMPANMPKKTGPSFDFSTLRSFASV